MNILSSLLSFIAQYIGVTETLTPTNQVAQYMDIRKVGKTVTIILTNINNLPSGSASNAVVTLPEGWRPAINFAHFFSDPNMTNKFRLNVASSGTVNVYNYLTNPVTSSTNASMVCTYIAEN